MNDTMRKFQRCNNVYNARHPSAWKTMTAKAWNPITIVRTMETKASRLDAKTFIITTSTASGLTSPTSM